MRIIYRLSQPLLAIASAPQCVCAIPTAPMAARRALSTTTTLQSRQGMRRILWKKGDAPGPENVDDPAAAQALREEQRELDLAEAQAEAAAWEARRPLHRDPNTKRKRKPGSRLKLKNERRRAPTPARAEKKGYVPAKTIDGLEEIGGFDGWWDRPGHCGEESRYVGFSSRSIAEKIEDRNVCEALVRQALVETLVLWRLDKGALKGKWAPGNRKHFNRATAIRIKAFEAGSTIEEEQLKAGEKIAQMVQRSDRADVETGDIISAKEAKALVETWGPKWKATSIQDPLVKFAFHKRVFQLTGHYLHDAKLAQVNTVHQFVEAIVKPPKPIKVAEAIVAQGSLLELPNVKVSSRRVTPIDKEIALGRWKVIQEELEKRDLPVTGHEHLQRPVERRWIQGKE